MGLETAERAPSPVTGPVTTSEFEATIRLRAARLGMSLDELLEHDRKALRESDYPTPECLNPYEVERYFYPGFPEERIEHVVNCAMCSAVVDVAQPSDEVIHDFLRELRRKNAPVRPTATQRSFQWRAVLNVLMFEVPLAAACLLLPAFLFDRNDAAMASVLSDVQREFVLIVLGSVLLSAIILGLLRSPAFKWPAWRKRGQVFVRTAFASFLLVCMGTFYTKITAAHQEIQSAQIKFIREIAERSINGEVRADFLLRKNIGDLNGEVFAQLEDVANRPSEAAPTDEQRSQERLRQERLAERLGEEKIGAARLVNFRMAAEKSAVQRLVEDFLASGEPLSQEKLTQDRFAVADAEARLEAARAEQRLAETQLRAFRVYWEGSSSRKLATVYHGMIGMEADGKLKVQTLHKDIEVAIGSVDQHLVPGQRVIAVVPANTATASQVIPIHQAAFVSPLRK